VRVIFAVKLREALTLQEERTVQAHTLSSIRLIDRGAVRGGVDGAVLGFVNFSRRHCDLGGRYHWYEVGEERKEGEVLWGIYPDEGL
jgi:hypothetical protein